MQNEFKQTECPRCHSFDTKTADSIQEKISGSVVALGTGLGCLGCLFFPLIPIAVVIILIGSPFLLIAKLTSKKVMYECKRCHYKWPYNHVV
jgi:hypothetical protein